MKNVVALFSFVVLLGAMIRTYLIPQMGIPNNIDQLEFLMAKVKQTVPASETVYFFSNNPASETEIRFKTQFVLAPRVVVKGSLEEIPLNSYILFVDDKTVAATESEVAKITLASTFLHATNNEFIVSLLKKKQ